MIWTSIRKEMAIASAETWHGTPHRDFLAIRERGVDCIHLLREILVDAGIIERAELGWYDPSDGIWSVSRKLVFAIETALHVESVEPDPGEFGQIWIFKTGGRSGHCGIVLDGGHLWHALAGRMVTRSEAVSWRREVQAAFRLVKTGWKTDPRAVSQQIK